MYFHNRLRLRLVLIFLAVVCFAGCATVEKAKDYVIGPEQVYLKKIAVEGISNRTYFNNEQMNEYARSLNVKMTEIIRQDPWLKVIDSDALTLLTGSRRISRDNRSVMEFGREWGVSALLKGNISELTYSLEKFGIYGFRDEIPTIRLRLQVQLIDTETGTVIYQGAGASSVKIDPRYQNLGEYLNEKHSPPPELMDETLEDLSEEIVEALEDLPWKAYIVKTVEGGIEISSGKELGLAGGAELAVVRLGNPMTNYLGQTFYMPGNRIGSVRLAGCEEHFCLAEPLDGVEVKPGDAVTLPD